MRLASVALALLGFVALSACDSRIGRAKDTVSRDMKDPASVQFRDVKATDAAVCGEVNAKNSYGAYVGFRRFVVADGRARVDMDVTGLTPDNITDQQAAELQENLTFWSVWNKHCSDLS